jgi:hypothetical protein
MIQVTLCIQKHYNKITNNDDGDDEDGDDGDVDDDAFAWTRLKDDEKIFTKSVDNRFKRERIRDNSGANCTEGRE